MVRDEHIGQQLEIDFDIHIDLSPYQVVDTMHLVKLDNVFRMLKLNQAYVTKSGRLVGIVSRVNLKNFIGQNDKKPIDRCLDLFLSIFYSIPSTSSSDSSQLNSAVNSPVNNSLFGSPSPLIRPNLLNEEIESSGKDRSSVNFPQFPELFYNVTGAHQTTVFGDR